MTTPILIITRTITLTLTLNSTPASIGSIGPQDVGTNNALPRRALPEEFTKDLKKKVAHISFASNPCRIRFFTQEIVLFREDLIRKMQRHTVVTPSLDESDISQQLVESICDQAHLCPLPLHVRPVYWDLDHTLRLTPLPHLVRNTTVTSNLVPAHSSVFLHSDACLSIPLSLYSSLTPFLSLSPFISLSLYLSPPPSLSLSLSLSLPLSIDSWSSLTMRSSIHSN